ncbi:hypothetical protein LJ707_06550 [Mucilaginibacter sp. UR6-1]|uniref:glycosyl hydrolase n=1 Tax=Mucilaginibacter sp. UR6-1 TaxID=1435643 RepID=UPI001E5E6257|nr:glycosyl hydrolase [Mucilaginibacter sp. UR6-1]MCC8408582.1 hypothetical protein [Mucilaginibacter sp. UR6-1]
MKTNTKKIICALVVFSLAWQACKKDSRAPEGDNSQPEKKSTLKTAATTITKEAEQGTLTNGASVVSNSASSGGAYVNLQGGNVSVTVNVPSSGNYDVYIRVAAPSGVKTNNYYIDNTTGSFTVQQSANYQDFKLATANLAAGNHTIQVRANWGWINVDNVRLVSVSAATYNLKTTLANTASSTATQQLFAYMRQQFRTRVISGQTDGAEFTFIKNLTGRTPLLRGYDMQPYSPRYPYSWDSSCGCQSFGANLSATNTNDAIAWYNNNAKKPIIQFQWHWHSPMGGSPGTNTFYTSDTNFDVTRAVTQGTAEYTATIRDIDAIAVQLKKLRDAGVPVLWRPLHEVGGTWFWWSAKGPAAFKSLWNLMYDRLTNYHQLNNLIWVWNGNDANWYVGNDKCDVASIDYYGTPFTYPVVKDEYDKIYAITGGTKILGMSENGSIPNIDQAFSQDVTWAFFMTWYDHITSANTNAMVQSFYTNPKVITLENR